MHPILNHIIAQHPDIRAQLARHCGRILRLSGAGLTLTAAVTEQGYLQASAESAEVTLTFHSSAVGKILQGQTPGVGDIGIGGDHALGMALLPLLGELHYRWDDDIARLFGDTAAGGALHLVAQLRAYGAQWQQEAAQQLAAAARRGTAPVLHRYEWTPFVAALATLRDDTARLQARLYKLEQARQAASESSAR